MLLKILFFINFIFFAYAGFSQYIPKKKDIKDNNIQSITTWDYKYTYDNKGQAKETKYKSSYTKYYKNGEILEETEYEPDGTIKNKKTYKYNSSGNKIEEITYNSDGSIAQKETYKYNADGMRVEKRVLSPNDRLESGRKYEHTYY